MQLVRCESSINTFSRVAEGKDPMSEDSIRSDAGLHLTDPENKEKNPFENGILYDQLLTPLEIKTLPNDPFTRTSKPLKFKQPSTKQSAFAGSEAAINQHMGLISNLNKSQLRRFSIIIYLYGCEKARVTISSPNGIIASDIIRLVARNQNSLKTSLPVDIPDLFSKTKSKTWYATDDFRKLFWIFRVLTCMTKEQLGIIPIFDSENLTENMKNDIQKLVASRDDISKSKKLKFPPPGGKINVITIGASQPPTSETATGLSPLTPATLSTCTNVSHENTAPSAASNPGDQSLISADPKPLENEKAYCVATGYRQGPFVHGRLTQYHLIYRPNSKSFGFWKGDWVSWPAETEKKVEAEGGVEAKEHEEGEEESRVWAEHEIIQLLASRGVPNLPEIRNSGELGKTNSDGSSERRCFFMEFEHAYRPLGSFKHLAELFKIIQSVLACTYQFSRSRPMHA
jgi:hypothetical protein